MMKASRNASARKIAPFQAWWKTSFRSVLRFKWNEWKTDTRKPLLSVIEVILAVGIASSIAVYLDPDWNVVAFPWNVLAFTILLGMAIWVHRRTRPYRIAEKLTKKKNQAVE